ncbi:hypothetical protein Mcup_1332 [Metallosphaera cuprina Ar-4]|uniref:Uncharacterized protein n=1 Tax=Metallosphaera cuprina (strain Ar-4) TaxID=1006006 RepID=F4FY63_METCR|nr:hypothetical protein Mcup_1332 [Metallosphaera cuprina Ar-4]
MVLRSVVIVGKASKTTVESTAAIKVPKTSISKTIDLLIDI